MTATATATGLRSWVATRNWSWLTPQRVHRITLTLVAGAIIASALIVKGSTPAA